MQKKIKQNLYDSHALDAVIDAHKSDGYGPSGKNKTYYIKVLEKI